MSESPLVMEWTEEVHKKAYEEGFKVGFKVGFKEGFKEGQRRGALRVKREDVLQVLQTRFPGQLTAGVIEAVNKQEDLETLDQCLLSALTAFHVGAFQAAMRR